MTVCQVKNQEILKLLFMSQNNSETIPGKLYGAGDCYIKV